MSNGGMAEFWPWETRDRACLYPAQAAKNFALLRRFPKINPTDPPLRLRLGMVEKSAKKPAPGRWSQWSEALEAALHEARSALASGEAQDAERRAKAVSAFAKAIRDTAELAEYARTLPPEEDVEAIREELRRRIARFIDADKAGADLETLERIGAGQAQ